MAASDIAVDVREVATPAPAVTDRLLTLLLGLTVGGLAAGGVLRLAGQDGAADVAWSVTTFLGLVPALYWVAASLRRRQPGVDVIAVLALIGTLAVAEYVAGALIAVMLASGRVLEVRANVRAQRDLRLLLAAAPRVAHRYEGRTLTSPPLEQVRAGDLLLVRPGEVVPVDGRLERDVAVLDTSSLTGEAVPVELSAGEAVRSGAVNAGGPFDLRATTAAADSTYAGIVRLVRDAQAGTAPFVRLADRYAAFFLPLALAVAGVAWGLSGQAVRAVAVLVVATPCPLILAAPVAIVSGLSRAARRGVIIKGGGALERLAGGETLLFDKTGTLTAGRPAVTDVVTADGSVGTADEVLRMAASLDQVSPHVLAGAVVTAARRRGLPLTLPESVAEVAGSGIRGRVDGHAVTIGKAAWVGLAGAAAPWVRGVRRRSGIDNSTVVFVGIDGVPAGAFLLDDPIRPDAPRMIRRLRKAGIHSIVMVTGDRAEVAETVGMALGVDTVLAERTPADKVDAVRVASREHPTIMVGDGVNDAPALAAASVGVAVASRGSTASSETADVVLTVDRLDRLADAIGIARRSRSIALRSVALGMGLSLLAMVFAALGALPPAAGALLQEAIDVAAIGNALRALGRGRAAAGEQLSDAAAELSLRFAAEHQRLWPNLDGIRAAAAALGGPLDTRAQRAHALDEVREVHRFCVQDLLPHEDAEDSLLYPALGQTLGGPDPTGTMSRGHVEIHHLVRRLGRLLDDVHVDTVDAGDVRELQQALYGLHAILRLHFAQEEEGYFTLADAPAPPGTEPVPRPR
jgi:heavy metal translocating P-type ATPase